MIYNTVINRHIAIFSLRFAVFSSKQFNFLTNTKNLNNYNKETIDESFNVA